MKSVSNKQIPASFRAYRPKALQWLGAIVLSFFGWKVNGNISDDALRLLARTSEGSVRDAVSLLDRVLVSQTSSKDKLIA